MSTCLADSFVPGKVYLVKSTPDMFWWHLSKFDKPSIFWEATEDDISELVEYNLSEGLCYVFLFTNIKNISLTLEPRSNYYFFLLSEIDGSLDDSSQKLYKKAGGDYISVDLTKVEIKELFKDRLMHLSESDRDQITEDLQNPFRLNWQLSSKEVMDYEVPINNREIITLLESLNSNKGVLLWDKIDKRLANSVFIPGTEKNSIIYKILCGTGNSKGWCPALWGYLNIFIQSFYEYYYYYPEFMLKLFCVWIRLCNTTLSDSTGKGISVRVTKGRKFYNFNPSVKSYLVLKKLQGFYHGK